LNITVLAIGKVREPFYRSGMSEYAKRLSGYCGFEIIETVKERSGQEKDLEKAYLPLRKKHMGAGMSVALHQGGRHMTSEALAGWLEGLMNEGTKNASFVLGGPHGLAESAVRESRLILSLSEMTLPHQMARLLLVEQLYRAFTIIRGEPYHK